MRFKTGFALVIATLCCALFAQSALAAETQIPRKPAPSWLTDSLKAQIHAAGAGGLQVPQAAEEEPGDDFALIQVYPEVAQKWGVNPAIPTGGPQGVYDGCDPQLVKNYGHGYVVYMGQGKPEAGAAPHWYNDAYGWFGVGVPGDSGSGITIQDNRSAGDFTHIIIFDPTLDFAPGELVGTRSTAILQFLGSGWAQVNADGTTSTSGPAQCGTSVNSASPSGGGGGGGGGKGGPHGGGGKGGGK